MKTEYIEKESAITVVGEAIADGRSWFDALCDFPPSDVKPVERGKWVRKETTVAYWHECSNCGLRRPRSSWGREWSSDYCPGCGADMRGGDAE